MRGTVVIAVGNEFRRDDGAGLAAVERARARLPRGIGVVVSNGETSRLLDAWDGAAVAVVVDAARTGAAPGTVHRAELSGSEERVWRGAGGSHALGVGDAVSLGRALGRLPARLIVYGIEGADFGSGQGLSQAAGAAVDQVADAVVAECGGGGS